MSATDSRARSESRVWMSHEENICGELKTKLWARGKYYLRSEINFTVNKFLMTTAEKLHNKSVTTCVVL